MRNYSLLLIEDDLPLAKLICNFLNKHEFDVCHVANAEQLVNLSDLSDFHLVLSDIMLPDSNGFELFKRYFQFSHTSVLFLTALDAAEYHIQGLELGAVDYITKPVSPDILLARIRAHLRTKSQHANQQNDPHAQLEFDEHAKQVRYQQIKLPITVQEFEILKLLSKAFCNNVLVDRDSIFTQIIGRDYDGKDRAADLVISRLRRKLEQQTQFKIGIKSIRNQGYSLFFQ